MIQKIEIHRLSGIRHFRYQETFCNRQILIIVLDFKLVDVRSATIDSRLLSDFDGVFNSI